MSPKKFVLLLIVAAYLALSIIALVATWQVAPGEDAKAPEFNDAFLLVATSVSGIMVSAFAVAMNVPAPSRVSRRKPQTITQILLASARIKQFFKELSLEQITKSYYVWAQIIIGVVAIITWIARPELTPAVVKNIASLSVTLFVAVATDVVNSAS